MLFLFVLQHFNRETNVNIYNIQEQSYVKIA